MSYPTRLKLPEEFQTGMKRATRLEWITLFYLLSAVGVMYLVLGSSQAMKVAWLEDALSIIPSVCFLIASKIYHRKPNRTFPYGYHRVFSIAFLIGSFALFDIGCFLTIDSTCNLLMGEHPTIGSIELWGYHIWLGWLMMGALLYSSIPSMFLGFKKLSLARQLHCKILYTDAMNQKADYLPTSRP